MAAKAVHADIKKAVTEAIEEAQKRYSGGPYSDPRATRAMVVSQILQARGAMDVLGAMRDAEKICQFIENGKVPGPVAV